ncbi:MAG: sulfurtransferase TusA family protein [Pseudomonadota bacterium]
MSRYLPAMKQTDDSQILDTRGYLCPLPVLRLRKALAGLDAGAHLVVLADDPVAEIDIPHFCLEAGHSALAEPAPAGTHRFRVTKGAG